jgi:transposase-like protein
MADPQCQVSELAKRYGVSRTTLYKRAGVAKSEKAPL